VINCGDCASALNSYLDRELSDDDIVQVRHHLDACGGCLYLYQFEESVRRLVRVRCQEQGAPESLRAKVTITLAMERLRQEEQRRRSPRGISSE
jgi:mycothiol system anti-sigma-R factor